MSRRIALVCCKIYVSASANTVAIEQAASKFPRAPLLHTFKDEYYNRVGYTLAGECSPALETAVVHIIKAAVDSIDLSKQTGSHPRLGVVDNVCFNPLGTEANMEDAVALARACAQKVGAHLQVPAFLYDAANDNNESLDSLRRALGYFRPTRGGLWEGTTPGYKLPLSPHYGPDHFPPETGVILIGASPWVTNYNVPLVTDDLELARGIARRVAERGGGLPRVQAMALLHGNDCIEIACNLLDVGKTDPTAVQNYVESLTNASRVKAQPGYLTNLLEEQIYELTKSKLGL